MVQTGMTTPFGTTATPAGFPATQNGDVKAVVDEAKTATLPLLPPPGGQPGTGPPFSPPPQQQQQPPPTQQQSVVAAGAIVAAQQQVGGEQTVNSLVSSPAAAAAAVAAIAAVAQQQQQNQTQQSQQSQPPQQQQQQQTGTFKCEPLQDVETNSNNAQVTSTEAVDTSQNGGGAGVGPNVAAAVSDPTKNQPKRLHVSNIPFRFRDPDLRAMFGVMNDGVVANWANFLIVINAFFCFVFVL